MIAKFTAWLLELVLAIFTGLWDFFTDIVIAILGGLLSALAAALAAIPAPSFLSQYSISNLIGTFPGEILYFAGVFNLSQCFAILAAGFAFRITRKIVTLGQW